MTKKPTSVVWPALSVLFLVRGFGTTYSWLKHGFPLNRPDWPTGIRIVQFVVGALILIIVLRRQYLLHQPTSAKNSPS